MPTGYTEPLYAGTPITFPEFALRCARAMGVAIMQRDESIDVPIREREVEPYYAERVTRTEEALTVALARTTDEWQEARDAALSTAREHHTAAVQTMNARRERYEAMLEQVQAWKPPTSQHEGLRRFMIDQLTSSIEFDTSYPMPEPVELTVEDYRAEELSRLARDREYAVNALSEQRKIAAEQRRWLLALRVSLLHGEIGASTMTATEALTALAATLPEPAAPTTETES
jgi:hypothetical protein